MKLFSLIGMLVLCGCCGNTDDPAYNQLAVIQLNLDYRHNGFAQNDTTFRITNIEYGNNYFSSDFFYPVRLEDSIRSISIYSLNCEKLIIESMKSGFTDTIINLGYNSEEVKTGGLFCNATLVKYYNVHATYKGQFLNSGADPILKLNVIK